MSSDSLYAWTSPSDVDSETWTIIQPLLQCAHPRGRPFTYSLRAIYDGIQYVLRGGIPWRMLPGHYPPWPVIYYHFRRWSDRGVWERAMTTLRRALREALGRSAEPTAGVIDSQSVETGPKGGAVGNDPGKKVRGRKRHIVTDTEGFPIAVTVTPANVQDPLAATEILEEVMEKVPTLQKVWADRRYVGKLLERISQKLGIAVEVVAPDPTTKGFAVLPRRWVIERTFAWLGRYRRLARDWEAASWSVIGMLCAAITRIFANRLVKMRKRGIT